MWWRPAVAFVTHVTIGSFLFALIAGLAGLIDIFIRLLAANGISHHVTAGLGYGEVIIFLSDAVMFSVFLTHACWQFIRSLDWKSHDKMEL